jgi:hypothetical protein
MHLFATVIHIKTQKTTGLSNREKEITIVEIYIWFMAPKLPVKLNELLIFD